MSRSSVFGRVLVVLALFAALAPAPAFAEEQEQTPDLVFDMEAGEESVSVLRPGVEGLIGLQASDPLGLVLGYDRNRSYAQSTDRFDLWTCGTAESATSLKNQLNTEVVAYFDDHSGGAYDIAWNVRGEIGSSDDQVCGDYAFDNASADATGAVVLGDNWGGGVAWNQYCSPVTAVCPGWDSFPNNLRIAFVGTSFLETTAAHEIGHLIQWPHSFTGQSSWEYDVASDLMSGNLTTGGYTNTDAYETAAINRYAAGWIDAADVWIVAPGGDSVTLSPTPSSGYQMAVIWSGTSFYTLAARAPETFDPIPSGWSGVEVYKVTPCTDLGECTPGFRRVYPEPATPFTSGNPPHIIPAGGSRSVGGVTVSVSKSGSNFVVQFGAGADQGPVGSGPGGGTVANGTFSDDDTSVFESDIEWLVAQGITKGCGDGVFCPNDPVTRGAMAAFLHRALPGLDDSGAVPNFTDIAGSVFLNDIQWLAATGVTKGCSDTRYCPNDPVTRGAMAAFLVRALGLTAQNSVDFTDDNNSVFQNDIEKLATAGITLGCNPPQNTKFCPNDPVTRGAMAAFLHRAFPDL